MFRFRSFSALFFTLLQVSSSAAQDSAALYAAHNEAEISTNAVAPIVAWLRSQRFALRTASVDALKLPAGLAPDASIDGVAEETAKARKILERVFGNLSLVPNSLMRSRLYWISGESVKRSADIVSFRDRAGDGKTFRQLFRVSTPTKLAGYTASTRRTIGLGEGSVGRSTDDVRIFSPLLNRSRPATEANRADPLFGGALSLDDLEVASENFESFDAKVVAEKEIMLPFLKSIAFKAAVGPSSIEAESPATEEKKKPGGFDLQVAAPKGGEFVSWNFQSRELPQFSPWVPTNIYFVVRPVWIIELLSRDPYYPHGKFYLVIDRELHLPFYKMVYDRVGEYRKTIVGSWGLIDTGGKLTKTKVPFNTFVLAVDQSSEIVNVLNAQSIDLGMDVKSGAMELVDKWFKQTQPAEKKSEVEPPKPVEPEEASDAEAPAEETTDSESAVSAQ